MYRDGKCSDGGAEGTVTTDPNQIDGVVSRAWKRIYDGNIYNAAQTVTSFVERYSRYLWVQDEFQLPPIQEEDVWENFQSITESAGGMDGWDPLDFKYFSR